MGKPARVIVAFAVLSVLLTACSSTAKPTSSPSVTSPHGASTPPSATPSSQPSAASGPILTAGDCTVADMQAPEPTVYTVYTDDSTTPVTIRYTAFNRDGTTPTQTLTAVGPVINILGYACTLASNQSDWVLTATHTIVGSLTCVEEFAGRILKTDTQEEANKTVDCTANPGR